MSAKVQVTRLGIATGFEQGHAHIQGVFEGLLTYIGKNVDS